MLTDKQKFVLDKAKEIIAKDKGSIGRLGDNVAEFCMENGICTRCHCRWTEPMKKNCPRCLAYKRIHKINAKNQADAGPKKTNKRLRGR